VFIPIAEETQIIRELGAWTLRAVCEEAANWPNPLKVAVNLSPVQLDDTTLPKLVQEILFTTGMTADRLELEVTETALIRNPQRTLDVLRRLKALGIRIAMDDFGTGYSSLSTLQAFPFDKIKIDKSFVERVDTHGQAASIVKAVLSLGRSLKIPVLVEGVETERQLAFLAREGAEQIQGYLVGRPQPIARYESILRKPHEAIAPDMSLEKRA
jgi:EAL domain-containing protein (putative c-di-GMP-specific phosphodiesterase class I)